MTSPHRSVALSIPFRALVTTLALSFGAMLLTSFVLSAAPANAQQTKEQQKCIVEMNKNVAKVAKAQGKDICKCIKDGAKGKLVGQSIEACTTADNKGKVAKAKAKLKAKVADKCPTDPNSLDAPDFGAEIPPDPNFHIQAAIDAELSLAHWIFGSDLDAAIVRINKETDKPTDPNAIPTTTKIDSKCQVGVAKAAKKCLDTKWKVFNKCKKNGLKGKTTLITSAQELTDDCLGVGTAGQPDPKGKIAKACITKLLAKIDKKCGGGVNLSLAFPLYDPFGPLTLREFVDHMVECEFCKLVNEVDGLERDCDLFDDGLANGSCGEAPLDCAGSGGVEVGGACWFLGALNEDCDAACASAGLSYEVATQTYAGSGGTFPQCEEVLDALGDATPSLGDAGSCGCGAGCVLSGGFRIRCADPVTNSTCSDATVERACACMPGDPNAPPDPNTPIDPNTPTDPNAPSCPLCAEGSGIDPCTEVFDPCADGCGGTAACAAFQDLVSCFAPGDASGFADAQCFCGTECNAAPGSFECQECNVAASVCTVEFATCLLE